MMTPMRIVSIVLVAFGLLMGVSLAFQVPFISNSRVSQKTSSHILRYDTSLHMGLRTFIKSKIGRGKDDDANGSSNKGDTSSKSTTTKKKNKKKPKAPTTTAVAATEKPKGINIPTQPAAPPPKKVAAAARKQVNVSASKESRLPPLRQESVKDRLNRVRSGKMTDDEKQAFLKTALSAGDTSTSRKPLRQELPDESRPMNSTGNATPMPKDSLLSNMARGWGTNGQNSTGFNELRNIRNYQNGAQLEDQKKKREYFEMVTNPDRFHTYKSSMVTAPGETDRVDPGVHDGLVIPEMGNEDEEEQQEAILEEEVIEEIREYEQVAGVEVEGDLGTRLEIAAHALEEAAKQREQERKEKEARMEQQRQEQKKRLAEIQKKQQLEMEKRELELKAKKREEEEAKAREMERKRREEEARRRKLEEAQDEYWAKKLDAEREERMQSMSSKQQANFVKHEVQAEVKAMEIEEAERKALEAERKALEAAEQKKDDVVGARIDIAAADYLSKGTTKPDAYEAIREKKRRESEQARDEQIARLKALNSPLPAPRASPTMSPVVPPASFASRSASQLSNLQPPPPPAPAPAQSEPTIAEMMNGVDTEEANVVESSEGSGFLSRMMGGKKESVTAPSTKKAAEPKRIVRQQLPLGDEEDDFDSFDRDGPNRKMSIADAMESSGESSGGGNQAQRSKMWGVDMTRIAKSLEDEKKK